MASDLIKLAAFWKKEGKAGPFLSGKWQKDVDLKSLSASDLLLMFPVKNKKNPKQPDYELFLAPPKDVPVQQEIKESDVPF